MLHPDADKAGGINLVDEGGKTPAVVKDISYKLSKAILKG